MTTPRRASSRVAAVALVTAGLAIASGARAQPSVWARAREPAVAERGVIVQQVDGHLQRYARLRRELHPMTAQGGRLALDMLAVLDLPLREAEELLRKIDAARSPDPAIRLRLAEVTKALRRGDEAAPIYESVARDEAAPAPLRAVAWTELAILHAMAGRHRDEIDAYGHALALEPVGWSRARLLANRAESFMALGDVERAVAGYRESLASLLPLEMPLGVTTLWGLAVALDRSGDLAEGLRAIALAREYDPVDRQIHGDGWFYVPAYDEAWYAALGHWSRARHTELASVRAEAFARAIESWNEYLLRAPATDRWLPLARARLAQCEKEHRALRRTLKPAAKKRPIKP